MWPVPAWTLGLPLCSQAMDWASQTEKYRGGVSWTRALGDICLRSRPVTPDVVRPSDSQLLSVYSRVVTLKTEDY